MKENNKLEELKTQFDKDNNFDRVMFGMLYMLLANGFSGILFTASLKVFYVVMIILFAVFLLSIIQIFFNKRLEQRIEKYLKEKQEIINESR